MNSEKEKIRSNPLYQEAKRFVESYKEEILQQMRRKISGARQEDEVENA